MKRLSLALLALVALAGAATQEGSPIRRALKAGTVDTYKVTETVDQLVSSPAGDTAMKIVSEKTYVLKTAAVDEAAGIAKIEATTTVDKMEAQGPASGMLGEKPGPATQTGKIDVRGRMTFDRTPTSESLTSFLSGTASTAMAGMFIELPERSVKVGDSWDIVVPKSPLLFGNDQKLSAKLEGERTLEDGTAAWVVSVKGPLMLAIDSAAIPGAKPIETPVGPTTVTIQGKADLVGEGLVEKSTGRTLSMTSKGTSSSTINLVALGIEMKTKGTVDSKVTLKK
jgi:hypothetical protein